MIFVRLFQFYDDITLVLFCHYIFTSEESPLYFNYCDYFHLKSLIFFLLVEGHLRNLAIVKLLTGSKIVLITCLYHAIRLCFFLHLANFKQYISMYFISCSLSVWINGIIALSFHALMTDK